MKLRNHYRFKGLALVAMLALLTTAAAQAQARFTTVNAATALQTNGVTRIDSSGNVTAGTISGSTLTASGASSLADVTASGTLAVTGISTFTGASTHNGALNAAGSGTGLAVTNNATVGGTLGVTGASTFTGAATANGALNAAGSGTGLAVTNNATVGGTLGVTGASTFTGAATANGALNAAGSGTGLAVTNNATIGGTLGVTGLSTVAALTASGLITGNAGFSGTTLTATGASTLAAITASGIVNLTGTADGLGLNKVAGVPGTLTEGEFWYDDTAKRLKYKDNAAGEKTVATLADSGEMRMGTVSCVSGALTKTVILSTAYSDAAFKVALANSGSNHVFAKVANKTSTGFDIQLEANPDTATFDFITMR